MRKAFVLLSGGLDSTTCLYKAIFDYAPKDGPEVPALILAAHMNVKAPPIDWVEAVSVNYGQRHVREMDFAIKTCKSLGIKHWTINVPGILGESLLTSNEAIPDVKYDEIEGVSPAYVPFRNGTLLSLITAHAQLWVNEQLKEYEKCVDYVQQTGIGADVGDRPQAGIYFGAHSEDAHNWAYPDCTPEFIGAMANAIFIGSYQAIRLHTPLMWLSKAEIVTLGSKLGVNFANTWSCYKGDQVHCGACPTCYARQQAFVDAGVSDPTVYKLKETA